MTVSKYRIIYKSSYNDSQLITIIHHFRTFILVQEHPDEIVLMSDYFIEYYYITFSLVSDMKWMQQKRCIKKVGFTVYVEDAS